MKRPIGLILVAGLLAELLTTVLRTDMHPPVCPTAECAVVLAAFGPSSLAASTAAAAEPTAATPVSDSTPAEPNPAAAADRTATTPASPQTATRGETATFPLRDGDRVIFLGNGFFERAQRYGHIEAMFTARYADADIRFRNLGWSGDTVWAESRGLFDAPEKGYARMLDHLKSLKPTVVLFAYGTNEAFAGRQRLTAFISQYEKLLDDVARVASTDVRFALLLPYDLENLGPPLPDPSEINSRIADYRKAIREMARRRNIPVLSILPDGADAGGDKSRQLRRSGLTSDGMHLTEFGYRVCAEHLFRQLDRFDGPVSPPVVEFGGRAVRPRRGFAEARVEPIDSGIRLHVRRRCLFPPGWMVASDRPVSHRLVIRSEGRIVWQSPAVPWRVARIEDDPDAHQYDRLRRAIVAKNALYFHRWRPQNFTYLFGFRKHEQGQNAPEVAEFEKLVAEKERQLAALRKPGDRVFELLWTEPADR